MKWIVLFAGVLGCAPGPREEMPHDAAAKPDAVLVPEGAWEPDPGLGRTGARLVADGPDVWFVYARAGATGASEVWLTKTTNTGDVLVPPMRVDGPELAARPTSIARSAENVAVVWQHSSGDLPPRLRMFDRNGQPLRTMGHLVPISTLGSAHITNLALAARADGSMRLFAAYEHGGMATELAVLDLDASGDPVGAAELFGTADGGSPLGLAAVEAGDATFVAWDRRYDYCTGNFDPDATVYTTVAGDGSVGSVADINPSGRSDREPGLAALGPAAYMAWASDTDAGSVIRVSRATDPSLGFVELGTAPLGNRSPLLALAGAAHGAIAWSTDEPALRVARLSDDGTNLLVGAAHVIRLPAGRHTLRGFVHVGGEQYVVSWTEDSWTGERSRVYALGVDLTMPPRPAPVDLLPPVSAGARGTRRCTH